MPSGFQLLTSFPNGFPLPLPPSILANDELEDIRSMYEFMDDSNKHWWESFFSDQTSKHPTQEHMDQFNEFWDFQVTEQIQNIET